MWIIVFGSEPDSYFGRFGPTYYGNTVGIVGAQHRRHQPTQAPFEMTGDKTILTDSAAPYGTANSAHSYTNYDHSHNATVNATSPTHPATATVQPSAIGTEMPQPQHHNQSNNVVYGEKVQALHACKGILCIFFFLYHFSNISLSFFFFLC